MIPIVQPISSRAELDQLQAAAATDDHQVVAPTHIARRGGDIVGYASIGAIPCVNVWLHSHQVGPRDSLYLLNLAENITSAAGHAALLMPCSEKSPFFPHMSRLGYRRLGPTVMHVKAFGPER